jgi:hypothetical protein
MLPKGLFSAFFYGAISCVAVRSPLPLFMQMRVEGPSIEVITGSICHRIMSSSSLPLSQTLLQKFVVADRSSSPHPLLLILLQVLAGSLTLPLLSLFGACNRPPHLTRNELLRVCLTSLLFFSNVVVGLLSLRILHVSVCVISALLVTAFPFPLMPACYRFSLPIKDPNSDTTL